MKPEHRLIELMRYASRGKRVCVIGEDMPQTQVEIEDGIIFFRNHTKSGLLSIRVDTIWFMDYLVPDEVERLGRHMTCLSKEPRIIRGAE